MVMHGTRDSRGWHLGMRLAAGAFGGLVGGLLFGVLMLGPAVVNAPYFGGSGMLTLMGELLGVDPANSFHLLQIWLIHAAASIVFGLLFSLAVPPSVRFRTGALLGAAYGVVLWLVAGFLALRVLTGAPLTLDVAAWANLAGHLVYGLTLGLVYPAFDHEEERVANGNAGWRAVPPRRS